MDLNWILIPPHPLSNFQIQRYYQNEPRFNGVYSRDNLSNKIKDGSYIINLHGYSDIGELIGLLCMHWIIILLILTVLELNTFQKKLKSLLVIKT